MRHIRYWLGVVFLSALVGFGVYSIRHQPSSSIAQGAALEWFQKPSAVRFVAQHDRTYYSWISHSGKIQLRYFDHQTKVFSKTATVRNLSLNYGVEAVDDHNAPSLKILPDGQILIYYAVHDFDRALFLQRSVEPENIFSWHKPQRIAAVDYQLTANYPKPHRLPDGELVLFFRLGAFNNSFEVMVRSKDNGRSWTAPRTIIDFGRGQGVYAMMAGRGNNIHLAWSVRPSTRDSRQSTVNIYTAHSIDGGQSWLKSDGSANEVPITPETAEMVYDSGADPAYIWDVVVDDKNQARIAFVTKTDPNHELRYARNIEGAWKTEVVTTSRQLYRGYHFYSGGIVIDPSSPDRVYISKDRNGRLELEAWLYNAQTASWAYEKSITKNSTGDNFRAQVVFDGRPEARLVWCSGDYEGLVQSQWTGYGKVHIESELTLHN